MFLLGFVPYKYSGIICGIGVIFSFNKSKDFFFVSVEYLGIVTVLNKFKIFCLSLLDHHGNINL